MARTTDSTFTCSPCASGTITMYTRADPKIPQPSMSKSHPSPQNNNKNIFHATPRDQPPSQPHPRAPKTLQAPAHLIKNEDTNTLMGQYQKNTYGTSHTHKPNPYRIKKSRKPQSQKPSAAEKKCHRTISRGAKGAGKTYLEGMTRARERGRSGRFGGGDGEGEVGTSSLAVSCWEDELGVVILGEERREMRRREERREEGFL